MATIYVATTGKDSAAGTTAAPMRTIGAAMAKAVSGDIVLVADGTYSEDLKPNMIEVKGGVTLRAQNRLGAKLRPPSYVYAIVNLNSGTAANQTVCDGFDLGSARIHNHGVFTNGGRYVKALNNRCFGGGESGVGMMKCDFVTIDGNEAFENAWQTWGSGISIYEPESNGEATPAGTFRMIVRNNISHHNVQEGGPYTDGNGIIIDDFQHWQNDPKVAFDFGFLVENNLCYGNGGKGFAIHWSNNGVMRRNTSAGNNLDGKNTTTWRGELSQQDCSGNRWEGNLAVPNKGANAANIGIGYYGGNSASTWIGNATTDAAPNLSNGPSKLPGSGNLFGIDPQLVDFVPTNPALADIGWRPTGVTPTPVPDPIPEPTMPAAPDDLSPFALGKPTTLITEAVAYELGTTIRADKAGRITALRLYRLNTTAQAIRLWKGGAVVASGTIPGGAEGWVETAVDVPAAAGDIFVVSVAKSAKQRYAGDSLLAAAAAGDGFTIPANGGVFATIPGALPTQTYRSSYYWVDVRFAADAVVLPEPEPEPSDLAARLASLETLVASMAADYGPRLIAAEEKARTADAALADLNQRLAVVEAIGAPDLSGVQEELARLDGRLDAIAGAAKD